MLEIIGGLLSERPTLFNSKGLAQLKANLAASRKENEILRAAGYIDRVDKEGYRRWTRPDNSPVDRKKALSEIGINQSNPLRGMTLPKSITRQ